MIRLVKRNELTNETKVVGLFKDEAAVLEAIGEGFKIYDKVYKNNTRYTHTYKNVTYILYDNSVRDEYRIPEPGDKFAGFVILWCVGCVLAAWLFGWLGVIVVTIGIIASALLDGKKIEPKKNNLPDDHETIGMMKGARL